MLYVGCWWFTKILYVGCWCIAGMSILVMILAGLVCGFIDSTLGMGYGVSGASVLMTFGVAPAVASATIHASEAVVDIVSGVSHIREGNVDFHISKHLLLPGVVASVLGAWFISVLSVSSAKPLVRSVLILLGVGVLIQSRRDVRPKGGLNRVQAWVLGFIAAFIDVAVGGGWGPIGTPALVLSGEEPRKAVGTIEFTEPVISIVAVLSFGFFIGFEAFLWTMALPMILGGFILTPLAARLTRLLPRRVLGSSIGIWLIGLNLWALLA